MRRMYDDGHSQILQRIGCVAFRKAMADRFSLQDLMFSKGYRLRRNGYVNAYMMNDRQIHVYTYNIGNRTCISFDQTTSYFRSQPIAGIVHEHRSADPKGLQNVLLIDVYPFSMFSSNPTNGS